MRYNLNKLVEENTRAGTGIKIEVSLDGFSEEIYNTISNYNFSKHQSEKQQFIEYIKGLNGVTYFERQIHNRGDGMHFKTASKIKRCFVEEYPSRKDKLYITCDLKVIPCPMIFNEELVLGDLRKQTLEEIYSSQEYKKFIQAMEHRDYREYPSCQNCNL